jgi:hypothetical protein
MPDRNEPLHTTFTTTLPQTTDPLTTTLSILRSTEEFEDPTFTNVITSSDSSLVQPISGINDWRFLPVIPAVSERAAAIYQQGLESGNNPTAFSKIGDGNISTEWFFIMFDQGQDSYDLGSHAELSEVIAHFSGSFARESFAAQRGFNTSKLLEPLSAGSAECLPNETPLECELRTHRPSIAILSLGTNQIGEPEIFEREIRQVLELMNARGVVALLSTKADNLEGDHRINRIIAQLAYEYEVPLWNFWRAMQSLPDHGLQEDNEHLTYGPTDFGDPYAMQAAWPVRNLTALQALDAVWRGLNVGGDLP